MEPAYAIVKNALKPAVKYGLKWTIDGGHHLPVHGPAILASNHSSYVDPLALAYLTDTRRRKARFLAKRELFEKRFVGWMLSHMGQIPVDRGTGDAVQALHTAIEAVRGGEVLVIFPEGTISLDLDPMPGKTGTARVAQESGVPVIPVGLWGGHRILFKGRPPKWRWGVAQVACIGPPVPVGPEEDVYEATDRIMEAICAQVGRARALYPQQPDDGDDWWVREPADAVLRSCRDDGRRPEEAPGQGAAQEAAS